MDRKATTTTLNTVKRKHKGVEIIANIPYGTVVWVSPERADGSCMMTMGRDGNDKDDPHRIGMINHSAYRCSDFMLVEKKKR